MDRLNLDIRVETDREVKEHIEALGHYIDTMQECMDYVSGKSKQGVLEQRNMEYKVLIANEALEDSLKNLLAKHSTIEIVGTKNSTLD